MANQLIEDTPKTLEEAKNRIKQAVQISAEGIHTLLGTYELEEAHIAAEHRRALLNSLRDIASLLAKLEDSSEDTIKVLTKTKQKIEVFLQRR